MSAQERAKVFKALADPRRIEIVDMLAREGSQCGSELAARLGVSLALLCHHWEVLAEAGLVKKERRGQLRICTLDAARLREVTGGWAHEVADKTRLARREKPTKHRKEPAE